MAKKAGAQQLQIEISNDEDFEFYLEKYYNALIVLDVYTEWCGPMVSAVNPLRTIKMQLGGDNLQLAVCKADYITKLRRFYKKSEPTWLFVREGKSVNIQLGADVPKLMDLIRLELERLHTPVQILPYIAIDDLHAKERKRLQKKLDIISARERKERFEREKKRRDYLMYCTDEILENLPDCGVTVFGPQVSRDIFKKLNETAEAMKISYKDKRYQFVTKADFETINFACADPLPDDVIEELTKQEILICFWKISEECPGTTPQVMKQYMHELTKKVVEPPDDIYNYERVTPPIIEPIKIKVPYEVDEDVPCPLDADELEAQKADQRAKSDGQIADDDASAAVDLLGEEEYEAGEGAKEPEKATAPAIDMGMGIGEFGMPGVEDAISLELGGEEEEEAIEEAPPKKICHKTVHMPAVWSPSDERTQAALIYVFFRSQTLGFLPPDPPPEPPHVIMAFDTYKKRDLISIAERNKDEIPAYGFFTSDDADEAKFIANSAQKYAHQTAQANDKLVFKVNKKTSNMMLSLVSFGATYVSPDTDIGKTEALKFFPADYRTAEQDRFEAAEAKKKKEEEEAEESGKRKKKVAVEAVAPPVEQEPETYDIDDFGDADEPPKAVIEVNVGEGGAGVEVDAVEGVEEFEEDEEEGAEAFNAAGDEFELEFRAADAA